MFTRNSLMTRIVIGKTIGLVIGIIGFFLLPVFLPDASWLLRWGLLWWYTTVGAFIGVMGVVTWHPVLQIPLPWWFRAPLIGGWMNFVLAHFAYDELQQIMSLIFGANGALQSPFWVVAEGMLIGLLIGFIATRIGGEGKEIVDM